jgi:hypothetical protein
MDFRVQSEENIHASISTSDFFNNKKFYFFNQSLLSEAEDNLHIESRFVKAFSLYVTGPFSFYQNITYISSSRLIISYPRLIVKVL